MFCGIMWYPVCGALWPDLAHKCSVLALLEHQEDFEAELSKLASMMERAKMMTSLKEMELSLMVHRYC